MGELIRREGAANPLAFSGERLTSATTGQVEIEHYHRYLLARDFCRGKDVLDVAAGEGYGTALLAQVATSATGVEIDAASVAAATAEFRHPNLAYLQGDARHLPLPAASVDVAVSFETLEHIAEHDRFLSELRRVLRPGGLLILSTPDRDIYSPIGQPPNPFHVLELTRAEFGTLVARHFPHAATIAQRALIGSVITGDTTTGLRSFERRGDNLIEANSDLARAPYLIAFASDAPLPPIPASVYVHRTDLDTDAQQRQVALDARNDAEQAAIHAEGRTAAMDERRLDAESRIDAALAQAAHYTDRTFQEIARADQLADRLAAAEPKALRTEALEREAAHLRYQVDNVSAHYNHVLALYGDAEANLRALRSSNLWRAAGPLRDAATRHPGAARLATRAAKLAWWTATLQLPARYRLWRNRHDAPAPAIGLALPQLGSPFPVPLRAGDIVVPSSPEPDISILVCAYGQVALTLACLRAIALHPPTCRFEVILLDDAYPGPEDVGPFAEVRGVRLVRNAENLGFLRSCNHAASLAEGRYLLLLNNDTEVRSRAIEELFALLERRPDAGMAGAKLLYPDGTLQEAGGIIWQDASGWNYGRGEDPARPDFNYVREPDYCSGAAIMVRTATWKALGGFDEAFLPAYYEDTDLAFRIRAAGQAVLYCPRAAVTHHEGASHGTDTSTGIKAHQVTNQARMLERWGATLARDNYPPGDQGGQHVLRARDHARHRRTILVIDHYTPEPDRDAGSRTMLALMDCLLEAGWTVKFWPHNRRFTEEYTRPLEDRGIEVLDDRWPGDLDTWLRQNGADLDHLMVSRPDVAADIMNRLLRNTGAVFSLYGHDLHSARLHRQADVTRDPAVRGQAVRMEQLERRVWRNFDINIYLSEAEAAAVRAMAPGTRATAVIPYSFPIAPRRTQVPPGRSILFVAGFAHPPNVDAAAFLVQEVIPPLAARVGRVQLVLAGSNPSDAVRALAAADVLVTGWLSDDALAARYAESRVAIVPLRFGAGVKGKVVEALSHGLPLVTTEVGAQGIEGLHAVVPVHDDVPGLVAALERLLTDDEAWLAQSHAQTDMAQQRFSRTAMRASVLAALGEGEAARQASLHPLPAEGAAGGG